MGRNLLTGRPIEAEVVQFAEAALLAEAFAPQGRSEQLRALAATLASGAQDAEMDRRRALQLACALRRLARGADTQAYSAAAAAELSRRPGRLRRLRPAGASRSLRSLAASRLVS